MKRIIKKPRLLNEHVLDPRTSLGASKEYTRERMGEGVTCPCCGQFVKIYPRTIHSTMARTLVLAYRKYSKEWFHLSKLTGTSGRGGEESKLRYWGLLEEEHTRRPDGGRSGWWRITRDGELFVLGELEIRKYAMVYNGRCVGHEGDWISIHDALGKRFSLSELMGRD